MKLKQIEYSFSATIPNVGGQFGNIKPGVSAMVELDDADQPNVTAIREELMKKVRQFYVEFAEGMRVAVEGEQRAPERGLNSTPAYSPPPQVQMPQFSTQAPPAVPALPEVQLHPVSQARAEVSANRPVDYNPFDQGIEEIRF